MLNENKETCTIYLKAKSAPRKFVGYYENIGEN